MKKVNSTMKIKIEGKPFILDIGKAIENGYLKPVITHAIGNIYRHSETDEYFILANVSVYKCCLVNLNLGNRWDDPVSFANENELTKEEWGEVCGSFVDEFEFVGRFGTTFSVNNLRS